MKDKHEFPRAFEKRVKNDSFLGEALLDALNTEPSISIRFNPNKIKASYAIKELVNWSSYGVYLKERPSFVADPLFHAGAYYPQEAGSMMLEQIFRALPLNDHPVVLDLCAAPGGKSTLLASVLKEKGFLVANEVIQARAKILRENLNKWGNTNVVVSNNDPKDFQKLPDFFDVINVDAPCSGEGMFRKDPQTRAEWSEANVHLCTSRQKRIVMDVWDALKPGGFLIYSTCTLNQDENEGNVSWMLNELDASLIELPIDFGLKKGRNGIGNYCLPHLMNTEGFYFAVLQKNENGLKKIKWSKNSIFSKVKNPEIWEEYANLSNVEILLWNQLYMALPHDFVDQMLQVQSHLHILKMGTVLGEVLKGNITPHHELLMNPFLRKTPQTIDLRREQALAYLHGDTFSIDALKGFVAVSYQEEPLGWIKHLGNRFNNLYPKDWRIRMQLDKIVF